MLCFDMAGNKSRNKNVFGDSEKLCGVAENLPTGNHTVRAQNLSGNLKMDENTPKIAVI